MAATAVSPRPAAFDIRSQSACPIRLGRSAEQPSSSIRYTSVQYNHKPQISKPERATTTITPPEPGSKLHSLRLKDGDDEYTYSGGQGGGEFTYVLLPDKDGNGYTLERLDASLNFNLSKAPWESDPAVLAKRYAQLGFGDADEDGELAGDDVNNTAEQDMEADADNPFDFRHYISTADSPSPQSQPVKHSTSACGTPSSLVSQASSRTSTPLAQSTRKAPKSSAFASQDKLKPKAKPKQSALAKVTKKPGPKRIKLSPDVEEEEEERDRGQDRRADAAHNIPTVRLDRRASTRPAPPQKETQQHQQSQPSRLSAQQQQQKHKQDEDEEQELTLALDNNNNQDASDDDDDMGDLILEGDAPPPSATSAYHRNQGQRSLGLALSGQFGGGMGTGMGNGPRSLLSAASSPASHRSVGGSPYLGGGGGGGRNTGYGGHGSDGELEIDMGGDDGYEDEGGHGRLEEEDGDGDEDGDLVLEDVRMDDDDDEEHARGGYRHDDADVDADVDVEAEADAEPDEDVDEMHLPSPAQVHRPSMSDAVVTADYEEEDDDLGNQLLLALEESEEESEEE